MVSKTTVVITLEGHSVIDAEHQSEINNMSLCVEGNTVSKFIIFTFLDKHQTVIATILIDKCQANTAALKLQKVLDEQPTISSVARHTPSAHKSSKNY